MDSDKDDSIKWEGPTKLFSTTLAEPRDWDAWFYDVKDAAEGRTIWHLVNPDLPEAPKGQMPPGPEPTLPTEQPSLEQLSAYDEAVRVWNRRTKDWNKDKKALQSLKATIKVTVDRHYYTIFKDPKTPTIWHWLRTLRRQLQPTPKARRIIVENAYLRTCRPDRRTAPEAWIKQFYTAYHEADLLGSLAVQDDRSHTDFLNAVAVWDPQWSTTELYTIQKIKDFKDLPPIDELIGDYRYHRERVRGDQLLAKSAETNAAFRRKMERGGGSGAVFSAATVDTKDAAENKLAKRTPPTCVCGDKHWYSTCPYLNDDAIPVGWQPDQRVKTEVDEKLKDQSLKDAVAKALWNHRRWMERNNNLPTPSKHNHRRQRRLRSTGQKENNTTNDEEINHLSFIAATVHSAGFINDLKTSWILDSGADIHITNNRKTLSNVTNIQGVQGVQNERVVAGATTYPILARGTASISVQTPKGKATLTLSNVAYIPRFMTNVVSLSCLMQYGVHWNTEQGYLTRNG